MEERLQAFLEYLQREYNYSNNTTAAYKNDLNQFVKFISNSKNKHISWSSVDAEVVEAYVESMKEKNYASSSVARKVAAVKSFFNYLANQQIIDENPTINIDSPKVKKRLPKTLTSEDIEKLLAAPTTKKNTQKFARYGAAQHAVHYRDARYRSGVAHAF